MGSGMTEQERDAVLISIDGSLTRILQSASSVTDKLDKLGGSMDKLGKGVDALGEGVRGLSTPEQRRARLRIA